MDYFQEILNTGDRIMDRIVDAVSAGSYSGLAGGIKEDLHSFSQRVGKEAGNGWSADGQTQGSRPGQTGTGFRQDAGPRMDTGFEQDAGPRMDTGFEQDTGPRMDTGFERDAGPRMDRGFTMGSGPRTGGGFAGDAGPRTGGGFAGDAGPRTHGFGEKARAYRRRRSQSAAQPRRAPRPTPPYLMNRPKESTGTGKIAAGAVLDVFCCVGLINMATSAVGSTLSEIIPALSVGAAFTVGFFLLLLSGVRDRKMYREFYKYASFVGPDEVIDIRTLANAVRETDEHVRAQLKRMLKKQIFPRARFNEQESALLLTDAAWARYCRAERIRKEQEEVREAEEEADRSSANADILRRGKDFLDEIRADAKQIPDAVMKEKLDRLQYIVGRILERVRASRQKITDLRKFTDYYLPTTQKLVNAYVKLTREPEFSSNVREAKQEIVDAMDPINHAFEVLFDSLIEAAAWDVSADIDVMKAMMEQDGLTGNVCGRSTARTQQSPPQQDRAQAQQSPPQQDRAQAQQSPPQQDRAQARQSPPQQDRAQARQTQQTPPAESSREQQTQQNRAQKQ
ncbi:MAG: 5-bromo-4-chloroindolyl phosphate hydrolysis family protein [Anaerovoracaceae bacterium]|jgi:hypothetical protein